MAIGGKPEWIIKLEKPPTPPKNTPIKGWIIFLGILIILLSKASSTKKTAKKPTINDITAFDIKLIKK